MFVESLRASQDALPGASVTVRHRLALSRVGHRRARAADGTRGSNRQHAHPPSAPTRSRPARCACSERRGRLIARAAADCTHPGARAARGSRRARSHLANPLHPRPCLCSSRRSPHAQPRRSPIRPASPRLAATATSSTSPRDGPCTSPGRWRSTPRARWSARATSVPRPSRCSGTSRRRSRAPGRTSPTW